MVKRLFGPARSTCDHYSTLAEVTIMGAGTSLVADRRVPCLRAGEGIPINKELVVCARQRAGLTLEEAAQKFRHIAAWEDGSALPTYPQLESMADEFKLPIAVFFFPEPPRMPPIGSSARYQIPNLTAFQRRCASYCRRLRPFRSTLWSSRVSTQPLVRLLESCASKTA